MSLLVGGGADVWAGVFVLSCRLLLDMMARDYDVIFALNPHNHRKKRRKFPTRFLVFFRQLLNVTRASTSWIFWTQSRVSRNFNQNGGLRLVDACCYGCCISSRPRPFFLRGTDSFIYFSTMKDDKVFQVSANTAKLFFSGTNNFGLNGGTINFWPCLPPKVPRQIMTSMTVF